MASKGCEPTRMSTSRAQAPKSRTPEQDAVRRKHTLHRLGCVRWQHLGAEPAGRRPLRLMTMMLAGAHAWCMTFSSATRRETKTRPIPSAAGSKRGAFAAGWPRATSFPGVPWAESIIDALEIARAMLLLFTASANLSTQIHREVERAVHKGVPVIPLRLENVLPTRTMEYFISTMHWLDAHPDCRLDRDMDQVAKGVAAHAGETWRRHGRPRCPRRRRAAKISDRCRLHRRLRRRLHRPPRLTADDADFGRQLRTGGPARERALRQHGVRRRRTGCSASRWRFASSGPVKATMRRRSRERFLREARSLQVVHPNIVHVRDFGESGDLMYMVDRSRGRLQPCGVDGDRRQIAVPEGGDVRPAVDGCDGGRSRHRRAHSACTPRL